MTDAYEIIASKQCSEEYIVSLLPKVELKWIYQHQQLSLDFIFNYIMNPEYNDKSEDSWHTLTNILSYQKHSLQDAEIYLDSHPQISQDFLWS